MESIRFRFRQDIKLLDLFEVLLAIVMLTYLVNFFTIFMVYIYLPDNLSANVPDPAEYTPWEYAIDTVFTAPFLEEMVFRVIPFALLFLLRDLKVVEALVVALLSSVIFGYLHGGIGNIFIQGISGFIFALVFLRWSQWGKFTRQGWLACSIVHSTYNGILILVYYSLS